MSKVLHKILAISVSILIVFTTVNTASAQIIQDNGNSTIQNAELNQSPGSEPGASPSAESSASQSAEQSVSPSADSGSETGAPSPSPSVEASEEPGAGPSASSSETPSQIATPSASPSGKQMQLLVATSDFAGGSGTQADPYLVSTPDQLNNVRNYPSTYFLMTNDIDMTAATSNGGEFYNSGAGWAPIAQLNGTFDGGGHKIIGLTVNRPTEHVGLFLDVSSGASVKNLGMVNSEIKGSYAGGICYSNSGMINHCYNTGHVFGDNNSNTAAGIAGSNLGTISGCFNTGTIEKHTEWESFGFVGGICGITGGAITNCFNAGTVIGGLDNNTGGIVGNGGAAISDCYNIGIVTNEVTVRTEPTYGALAGDNSTSPLDKGLYFLNANINIKGSSNWTGTFGSPLSNEQMQEPSSFVGFDFNTVWAMGGTSYPYPVLQGMPSALTAENTTDFAGGNGYPYDPYKIQTAAQLNNVRNYPGKCFVLKNDIDLSAATGSGGIYDNGGKGWAPINVFLGQFNGNGQTISGLKINRPGESNVGLFGDSIAVSSICNLKLKEINIMGGFYTGGLVGQNYAVVNNVSTSGVVNINTDTGEYAGGLFGETYGPVTLCSNACSVRGRTAGGIAGDCRSDIQKCSNNGMIQGEYAGGIAGDAGGTIADCYNLGEIGLINNGWNGETLGGIAGINYNIMENCYNSGLVDNGRNSSGGIAGAGGSQITNCYYLNTISNGASNGFSQGMVSETMSALKQQATFQGFDFTSVWAIQENGTTPYLQGLTALYPEQVLLNQNTENLFVGGSSTLTATVSPDAGLADNLQWVSSDNSVATVDQNGKVTAIGTGKAVITGFWPGGALDTCSVIVNQVPDTVSFDSRGGSLIASITANYDNTIVQPSDPTKPGYAFTGWYKDQACQSLWNFSTDIVSGDTTLYAGWTISQYTVSFNSNGGTQVDSITKDYNTTIGQAPVTSRPGFVFTGWYTDSALTQPAAFPYTVTGNATLYAAYTCLFAQGDGSASNPFGISTPEQLDAVRNYPNASFVLLNDIDMTAATSNGGEFYNSGAGWAPIAALSGTFDGGGHKIIGLQINRPSEYVGLFVNVNAGAKISNLGMVGENIYGGSGYKADAGGICSFNAGTIQYCYNTGLVCGDNLGYTGGIAGASLEGGFISNCYNTGTVKTKDISGWTGGGGWTGGITGYNFGSLQNCFNAGSISGMAQAGGITSSSRKGITNCYNIGTSYSPLIVNQYNSSGTGLYYYSADIMNGDLYTQGKPGTALTGSQMTKQSSFAGFDFGSQWTMGDASYPYPELQGMPKVSISENTTDFAGGTGLPNSPYEISTPAQLDNVRNFTGGYYILTNDIDMTAATSQGGAYYNGGKGFSPIPEFYGYFDGGGHSVIGIQINRPQENVGLYNVVEPGAVVYNMGMAGSNINGGHSNADYAGGLCAQNWGVIAYCYNTGHVCGDVTGETGGITGYMSGGIISNCYNTGTIDVDNESGLSGGMSTAGGIAGLAYGTLINCFNGGSVTGTAHAGGIIGTWFGTDIYNCYNAGAVACNQDRGALIGEISVGSGDNSDTSGLYYKQNGSITGAGTQSAFGTGLTAQQMQDKASFAGFDFGGVWTMGTDSYPYPVLQGFAHAELPHITADFAGGTGTTDDPYQVETAEQLNAVRYYPGASFVLENDIDLSAATQPGGEFFNTGAGWDPIDGFTGQFNGNGHVISGIRIFRPSEKNIGLFGTAATGSGIRGLILKDVNIQGEDYTASLVGNNSGLVADVAAYGTVGIASGSGNYAGGITGFNTGTIELCSNACNVSGSETGGMAGYNIGIIEKCSNSGSITGSSAGGIAGNSEGAIQDCYNLGSIIGTQGFLGGIAGDSYNNGSITNCYNAGFVASNTSAYSGGIAGWAWAPKNSNCYYVNTILNGVGDASSQNTYPESLDALKQQSTFQGFDFDNVWAIQENSSTPYLQNSTPLYMNAEFNSLGGSSVPSQTIPYNTAVTAPSDPTKTGYTFGGWYRDMACTIPWNFNSDTAADPTGYIGLYAKWNPNLYTVTFNSMGGTDVAAVNAYYNTKITAPVAPTKAGYTFGGWYTENWYSNSWNFSSSAVRGDTTLYAKWNINTYTISFDSQGGSTVAGTNTYYNCSISKPADPTKSGYAFGGWYKEPGCINPWNFSSDGDKVTGDTTLYAKWAPVQYSVAFNSEGGSAVDGTAASYNNTITKPADPTLAGYTFDGWYKESGCQNAWNFSADTVTGATTLFAKWTINQYTVTFNSQGGSFVAGTAATYNNAIMQPAAPTKHGYIFAGWYKDSGCANAWNFQTDAVPGDITLYAKWIADQSAPTLGSITLNANPSTMNFFKVTANGVIDPNGVKSVQFAVWSDTGGQDDLQWYNGVNDGNGNWSYTVNALNHKNDVGIYNIHVYGTDNLGNFGFMGSTTIDMEQREHTPPTLGSIALSANPCKTPTFKVTAKGVADPSGVKTVQFAVWSDNNGQDDLKWYNGVSDGKGNWSVTINAANHKNDVGIYHIHAYGTDKLGNFGIMGQTTIDMEQRDHTPPAMGSILLSANPCLAPTFKVTAHGVSDDRSGVKTVQFAVWSENNGQDDLKWYTGKSDGKGNWTATIKVSEHKNDAGIYNIHVYGTDKTGNTGFMGLTTIDIQ